MYSALVLFGYRVKRYFFLFYFLVVTRDSAASSSSVGGKALTMYMRENASEENLARVLYTLPFTLDMRCIWSPSPPPLKGEAQSLIQ